VEIPSPASGKVAETFGAEGDIVEVGATMVVIETDSSVVQGSKGEQPSEMAAVVTALPEEKKEKGKAAGRSLATPAVRKYARQSGVDLAEVSGSGSGGKITREDIDRHSKGKACPVSKGQDETIPYRGLRKRIGDHLVAAKRFAPHYTYVEEVDASQLVHLRDAFRAENPGSSITYLPFLVKAVAWGLRKFPLLNSTLDEEKQVIQLKSVYNIGIAIATDEGLVVPVVKNVDQKSILQLAGEIVGLVDKTRKGRVELADLKDGTFTITSLGVLGGIMATPIINYPEVAVLGVHKIVKKPVAEGDQVVVRHRMNLSLTLDHRVVDGIVGAQFMQTVARHLENPGLLALWS
jgi:pyruvate dehydrogenase E2 component (dihydrolipoamide acetyltransferase)